MRQQEEWPSIYSGPWYTRLRRYFFGLNPEEIAVRGAMYDRLLEAIRKQQEEGNRKHDEWWEREGKYLPVPPSWTTRSM